MRPKLLLEAIQSALNQSTLPFEILIGDDSPDDATEELIRSIAPQGVKIRYWHHKPSLGQAQNVQHLLQHAEGEVISLIHDDDRYRPEAFAMLIKPLQMHSNVIATFGKQKIISESGIEDDNDSNELNNGHFRTSDRAGIVHNTIECGILSMFPNNGFFVRREVAQAIDYVDDEKASTACDYNFGLRIGQFDRALWFCDEFVADYRITTESVARSGSDAAYFAFKLATELISRSKVEITPAINTFLKSQVRVAIYVGARISPFDALNWYFSRWHRQSILSLGGIKRGALLLVAIFRHRRPPTSD